MTNSLASGNFITLTIAIFFTKSKSHKKISVLNKQSKQLKKNNLIIYVIFATF